jgi:hypothetical protein
MIIGAALLSSTNGGLVESMMRSAARGVGYGIGRVVVDHAFGSGRHLALSYPNAYYGQNSPEFQAFTTTAKLLFLLCERGGNRTPRPWALRPHDTAIAVKVQIFGLLSETLS